MDYDDIKKCIERAVAHSDEFKDCLVTDAFPNRTADNPVKRTICAIGLLGAEDRSVESYGESVKIASDFSVFVDIYSPAALGGAHSQSLAFALLSELHLDYYSRYSESTKILAAEFVSSCHAYKTRIVISTSYLPDEKSSLTLGDSFNALFNGTSYRCRRINCSLSPVRLPVYCYGEEVPTAYHDAGERVEITVERYITDDDKSLRELKYPFRFDDFVLNGIMAEDCAVTEYEVEDGLRERVKIIGRRVFE